MPLPNSRFYLDVEHRLSAERLSTYRFQATDTDADVLARYIWNVTLCESLYPTLHAIEVAFRNAIHSAAARAYGSQAWFDSNHPGLLPNERDKIDDARAELTKQGKTRSPGRIVAALSFGFWTSLLNAPYERVLWQSGLLGLAFPGVPRPLRSRRDLSARFQSIRQLRNRAFHHEPIWANPDLQQQHTEIRETLGWLGPQLRDMITPFDRFQTIYAAGLVDLTTTCQELLSPPSPPPGK